MSFQKRLDVAREHEQRVLDALNQRGWFAEFFGQGQLTPRMREYLREVDTAVRWMPDIIASKRVANRTLVAFIDAKAGDRYKKTGNHDVEVAALCSAEKWIDLSGDQCPYYFVFDDGGVATPDRIRGTGKPGPYYGHGSGTPFLIFPTLVCRPFDAMFGPPLEESA